MTIRSHLLLLALAAFVPVLAFGVFASLALIDYERETQRVGAVDQARAMMTAIDAELRGSVATLQALAASRALAQDDLVNFHASATRVLATQPAWMNVVLAGADGQQLLNLATAPGTALGEVPDPASLERVVATLQPAVGELILDQLRGAPGVPVRVPVIREGRAAYVLTAIVRPDAFREIIVQQHLPPGWISGVVDRNLRFVARIPAVPAGAPASEHFRAAAARKTEGWYRGLTVEGTDTFTAHTTSPFSGWTIGLAIPTRSVETIARRSAMLMAIGALLSIGVAFAATLAIGRRIATPIRSLATAARSLGSGGDVRIENPERVREMSAVASALQEAAAAVRERQRLLEREKAALQAADTAKNEFLAMLSHELRNPLAALSSSSHLLNVLEPGHPSAVQARGVVERQTRHMTRLIEDLLDVGRITMGKASLERQRLDLGEAVSRVVDGWRGSGRLSSHRVEVATSPVFVLADRERLDQIVSNLLDNAVKFTPPGGRIAVTVGRANGSALIKVADDGEGISEDLIGRVFDLFVQGPHGIDRGKGGMGIGLALVKRLTEMHGGNVTASSQGPGKGATFTVAFPADESREVQARPRRAAPPAGVRRILLIEDNDDARTMLGEALVLRGHQVTEARDGKTGLAKAAEGPPEVAVVDIGLPDMDGYEVARRLRESMDGRISLIALSGYGQIEDRRLARDAGFELHLTKPVDVERLEEAIAALVSGSRPRPGS
jgi:signal transduction histidine kinase/ActR/RegA family two-component response regulator